ncbi:MAG: lysine--tRNA ligase [Fimbriimonas ginsengisoli]|uniref:Lysine--tRNA ligase n=1 Tax=Fimbriimonas ginsengisoli TaxID=1005039 RepID=A0A931LTJ5_FIMGI|nr:lysine--tRNA ligase [Fimbriimonas ginsengisoli]
MSGEQSIWEVRLQKLARMRELGHDPYAHERYERTHTATEALEEFHEGRQASLAGRVVSYRPMGKAGFAHVSDGEARIQAYFKKDDLGPVGWELFTLLDVGDHIGVRGELFLTKTGEKSVHVRELSVLSKALHAVPVGKEKEGHIWYGLQDVDQRYRHRHLDLICNPEARRMLLGRARIVSAVRRFMDGRGFLEVETPILQVEAGGAAATPFLTHYRAYDMQVKLRISLELYLKRILCGDVPKVYELSRCFRNEGISNRHNPEFTMLEFYEAYVGLEEMMEAVEELFRSVCQSVFGTKVMDLAAAGPAVRVDFGKPWRRVDLLEEIELHSGVKASELQDLPTAKKALERVGVPAAKEHSVGGIIEKLLERFVEPLLIEPTFVVGYPIEISPLAKKERGNPKFTRRFEGFVGGREVCNAFSEINDPIDQRERFEAQVAQRKAGNEEAHPMDEDFLFALECGMPPTGGCGIGIDRVAMLLTGADHIREVLFFPTMKPIRHEEP